MGVLQGVLSPAAAVHSVWSHFDGAVENYTLTEEQNKQIDPGENVY